MFVCIVPVCVDVCKCVCVWFVCVCVCVCVHVSMCVAACVGVCIWASLQIIQKSFQRHSWFWLIPCRTGNYNACLRVIWSNVEGSPSFALKTVLSWDLNPTGVCRLRSPFHRCVQIEITIPQVCADWDHQSTGVRRLRSPFHRCVQTEITIPQVCADWDHQSTGVCRPVSLT